jgi:hypothetical protein
MNAVCVEGFQQGSDLGFGGVAEYVSCGSVMTPKRGLPTHLPIPPGMRGCRPKCLQPAGRCGRGVLRGNWLCWMRRHRLQKTLLPLSAVRGV